MDAGRRPAIASGREVIVGAKGRTERGPTLEPSPRRRDFIEELDWTGSLLHHSSH